MSRESPEARSRALYDEEGWTVDKASQWIWFGVGPPIAQDQRVLRLLNTGCALARLLRARGAHGAGGPELVGFEEAVRAIQAARPLGKHKAPGHHKDLFGWMDLVAMRLWRNAWELRGCQATTEDNLAARVDKALGLPAFEAWLRCGARAEFHGWRRPTGKRFNYWRVRRRAFAWDNQAGLVECTVDEQGSLLWPKKSIPTTTCGAGSS